MVGEESRLLLAGEKAPELEVFMTPGAKEGRPTLTPAGAWKGLLPGAGTLRRRLGVRESVYMLCEREWEDVGEAKPDHLGLLWPVEKVADVGVLKSLGDTARYWG